MVPAGASFGRVEETDWSVKKTRCISKRFAKRASEQRNRGLNVVMHDFQAWNFFWCGLRLQAIEQDCLIASMPVDGDELVFALPRPLDDRARDRAVKSLKRIVVEFLRLGLKITAETTNKVISELETQATRRNFQWLIDQVRSIQGLSQKEIDGKAFFYVPAERARFFPRKKDPYLFGKAVGDAFPTAFQEIAESGACLALDRTTACVFHLMRTLEIGLRALGNKFGVSLTNTNWAPAIDQIEGKIRDMHRDPAWKSLSDWKQQQEFYAQAASHFSIFKDAWRNYTMHVRGFYTEAEAERVFEHVKAFMQKLSERLKE
jgi:hypothetical protein